MSKSPNQKKIVIVANTGWNILNFRMNVLKALEAKGYALTVVTPDDRYSEALKKLHQTQYIKLMHLERKGLNPWKELRLVRELMQVYRHENPDLILHYTIKPNIYGSLAAMLLRKKSICFVTGLGYAFIHKGLIQLIASNLYRLAFLFTKKVIFENEDDKSLFLQKHLSTKKQSIALKGCGVNTKHYSPYPTEKDDKNPNTRIFTFIGRVLYDKGVAEFVEAARLTRILYPDAIFRIVGPLDEAGNPAAVPAEKVKEWQQLGHIEYIGAVDDVRPQIAEADVLVLPSYREGMPRVILEGMAMAKPIITTNTAGCRETVEEGVNGYLVPLQDASALAKACYHCCLLNHHTLQKMGNDSLNKIFLQFDEKIITQQIVDIVQEVLEKK